MKVGVPTMANVHMIFLALCAIVSFRLSNGAPKIETPLDTTCNQQDHEFKCTSGECISYDALCDNVQHCRDGSDEDFCNGIFPDNTWQTAISRGVRDAKMENLYCGDSYFRCDDDKCIPESFICDEDLDCEDLSDEQNCHSVDSKPRQELHSNRLKRQTRQKCRTGYWQCRNGDCITVDGKCDGTVDCKDGTDESFATCRNTKCPSYLFRCAYGACVDGTAKCNNIVECADGSDEKNLDCYHRNITDQKSCGVNFVCDNGDCIPIYERCDGVANCADGSDENVLQCGAERCPGYLFRCAYGACVDGGSDCNSVVECADGSDENWELCNTAPPTTTTTTTTTKRPPTKKPKPRPPVTPSPQAVNGGCIVPPRSAGNYRVEPDDAYRPGDEVPAFTLMSFDCGPEAGLAGGANLTVCLGNNAWSPEAKCKRRCRALTSLTVDYTCEATDGRRFPCDSSVEEGTTAIPTCKPSYVSPNVLSALTCLPGGSWDYSVSCSPDCGTVTPKGQTLIVNGRDAVHGEFPWHVGIFQNSDDPSGYTNICGGSIVNAALVISAAHCFWVDGVGANDASQYAVAAGKMYRSWDSALDDPKFVQKAKVKEIHIPKFYGGIVQHYQADLALLVLDKYFVLSALVKPVCISFDGRLEQLQLVKGAVGKVAGWGLLTENGQPSEVLKTANLPYVEYSDCVASLPVSFQPFLVTDKICAGWTNGTAVCKGDSGGGLVFGSTDEASIVRHYLRGLVSNSPLNDAKTSCRSDNYAAFTKISVYSEFINELWARHLPK